MKPKLMKSEVTGIVYIVTKYKELGNGNYKAIEKYDVTKDFNLLVEKKQSTTIDKVFKEIEEIRKDIDWYLEGCPYTESKDFLLKLMGKLKELKGDKG